MESSALQFEIIFWGRKMYKHILMAVELDEKHDSTRSLPVVRQLAGEQTRVTVLHVHENEILPSYMVPYIREDSDGNIEEELTAKLEGIAEQIDNGRGVLVEGHSGRTIIEWAETHAVDCIVIASHRPGLQDYLLGSTAGRVVRHAKCSVFVHR